MPVVKPTHSQRRRSGRQRPRPGKPVLPWSPAVFAPPAKRRYSPQALALTLVAHLAPLLLLLLAPEWLLPLEKPEAKQQTRVELVPPPFVQVNPFANQQRVNTVQEGAQNQRAAQEAEPEPGSRATGPQLEGEDPRFNRIISGNPEAPDIAPAPLAAEGSSDSPNPPAAGSAPRPAGGNSFELQTRAEQQQAGNSPAASPTRTDRDAQTQPSQPAPANMASQTATPAAAPNPQATRPAAQPAATNAPSPAPTQPPPLTAKPAEQLAEEGLPPAASPPETIAAVSQQPAEAVQPTQAPQPAVQPTTEVMPQPSPAEQAVTETQPSQVEQAVATAGTVAQGTEETPAIDPNAPRPRPVLEPRLSAGPLRHQAVTANARGLVAIDSRFSEFGAYQQRMIEAISAQWYMLARQSRAIDSEYGTQVVLVFTMDSEGIVSGTKVRFTNASAAATLLCINAVESRSPFGPWTADMQRVLGVTQTVTFTFYYR